MAPLRGSISLGCSAPAQFATVHIESMDGNILATTQTTPNGRFSFASLPPGSYKLVINANGIIESRVIQFQSPLIPVRIMLLSEKRPVHVVPADTVSVQHLQAPKQAKKKLKQAVKAIRRHHRNRGMRLLSEAIRLAPNWGRPYFTRGVLLLHSHLYPQALHDLQFAAQRSPGKGIILAALGIVYRRLNQLTTAMFYLHRATVSQSPPWQAYYELGRINYSTGHYHRAGTNLRLALDRDPRHAQISRVMLGNVYIHLRQYEKARRQFTIYLRKKPHAPEASQIHQVLNKIDRLKRQEAMTH